MQTEEYIYTITIPEDVELFGTVTDDVDDDTGRPYTRCVVGPDECAAAYVEDNESMFGPRGWFVLRDHALAIPEDDMPTEWINPTPIWLAKKA
jgi:hypothetical protein